MEFNFIDLIYFWQNWSSVKNYSLSLIDYYLNNIKIGVCKLDREKNN
jgi:hypothetical protein